jgi:DNA-directed RNA polymerase subunit L
MSKIKVKKVHYQDRKGLRDSQLVLNFTGPIFPSLINSLKRTVLSKLPTYAFDVKTISIKKNTSVYNNDMMRDRISHMPIFDLNIPITYLERKYWYNIDYSKQKRLKHTNDNLKIELLIDAKNSCDHIVYVSTNDIKYYENNDVVNKYDKDFPIFIIDLCEEQEFKCHATAVLGVGENNVIWNSVNCCFLEYDEENNITMTLESAGQMTEYAILDKACDYLIYKLDMLNSLIQKDVQDSKNILIKLENEDTTIVVPIIEIIKMLDEIKFIGYYKESLLDQDIVIKMQLSDDDKKIPSEYISYGIDKLTSIYKGIKSNIAKLK